MSEAELGAEVLLYLTEASGSGGLMCLLAKRKCIPRSPLSKDDTSVLAPARLSSSTFIFGWNLNMRGGAPCGGREEGERRGSVSAAGGLAGAICGENVPEPTAD